MRHLIRDVFNKSWMNAVVGIVPVFTLVSGIGVTVQAVANTLDPGALIVEIEDNSGLTDGNNPHWVLLVMLAPGGNQNGTIANPVFKSGPKWTGSWGQPSSEALAHVGGNNPNTPTLPSNPNGTWMAFAADELHGLTGIGDGDTSTGFVDWSSSFPTNSNETQKVFPSMSVFLAFIPTTHNKFPPLKAFGSKFNDTTKIFQYPCALVTPSGEWEAQSWYLGTDSTIRSSPYVAGALREVPLAMPNGADIAAPWGSGVRWQRIEYQMQTYPSAGEAAGDADITILSRFGFPVRLDYQENATDDDPSSIHWVPASNVSPNVNKFEPPTPMKLTDHNVRTKLQKAIRSNAPAALKLQTIIRAEHAGKQSQIALVGPNVFGPVNPYNSFYGLNGNGLNGKTQNLSYWQQVAEMLPCIETSGPPDPEQGIHAGYCSSDNRNSLPTSLRIQSVNIANTVHSGNGAQSPTPDDYQHSVCDWYQNPGHGVEQYQCYACFTAKEYDVNDGSQTAQIDKYTLLITGELQPFTIDWQLVHVQDQDPSLWEGLNAKINPDKPYILSPEKPKALFNLSYLHGLCDTSLEHSCKMYAEVGADGKTITISQKCKIEDEDHPDTPFCHEVTVDISRSEWQDKTVADLVEYFVTPANFARASWLCDTNCNSTVSCLSGESKTNQGFCQLLATTGSPQQLENILLSKITLVQMQKTEIPKQNDNCSAQPLPDGLDININTDNASGAIYSGDWFGYANNNVSVTYGWNNNQSGHLYKQGVVDQQENWFEIDIRKKHDHSQTAKVKVEYTTTFKNIARDLSAAFQYGMLPTATNENASTQQFISINTNTTKPKRNLVLAHGTPPPPQGSSPFTLQEVPSGNWMLLNSYPPDISKEIPIFKKLQPEFLGPDLWAFSRYAQLAYKYAGPEIYGQAYSDFLTTTKHPGIPIVWEDQKFVKLKITIPSLLEGDFDGNSQVDIADLLHILQYWGLPYGDLDGNETTDIMDLLMVINSFGD